MNALWYTFPLLMLASIVIGWAAEITAVHLSAGMALAVLAWLQTLPEFAVEASIAWQRNAHLALANLTGSLRLLMGLGWPMVFFIFWFQQIRNRRGKSIELNITLPREFAVESIGLAIPLFYFLYIYFKRTWNAFDGMILVSFYALYFYLLNLQRKYGAGMELEESDEEGNFIVDTVLKLKKNQQILVLISFFIFGGVTLYLVVHPFIESLRAAALYFGVSEFVFIQWIAPVASEFPEKITAFSWARRKSKVPLAIVNLLSSVTNQWTLLAGLIPIIFSISAGRFVSIELTDFQRGELLLTIVQSGVAVLIMADLKMYGYEALALFVLWLAQFFVPESHSALVPIYAIWMGLEALRLLMRRRPIAALAGLKSLLFKTHR